MHLHDHPIVLVVMVIWRICLGFNVHYENAFQRNFKLVTTENDFVEHIESRFSFYAYAFSVSKSNMNNIDII